MKEQEAREAICELGYKVWQKNYVAANDGNISYRLDNGSILCTPTGISKGSLEPKMICKADADGNVISEVAPYKISSEFKVHLAIFQADDSVRSVVHAHPLYGTMFAIAGEPIYARSMPENIIAMPEIPVAPYATPSTQELADSIKPFIGKYNAVLMELHGALTWGDTPLSAYMTMERLEFTAHLTYLCRTMGITSELPEDEITKLIGMRAQYGVA